MSSMRSLPRPPVVQAISEREWPRADQLKADQLLAVGLEIVLVLACAPLARHEIETPDPGRARLLEAISKMQIPGRDPDAQGRVEADLHVVFLVAEPDVVHHGDWLTVHRQFAQAQRVRVCHRGRELEVEAPANTLVYTPAPAHLMKIVDQIQVTAN